METILYGAKDPVNLDFSILQEWKGVYQNYLDNWEIIEDIAGQPAISSIISSFDDWVNSELECYKLTLFHPSTQSSNGLTYNTLEEASEAYYLAKDKGTVIVPWNEREEEMVYYPIEPLPRT